MSYKTRGLRLNNPCCIRISSDKFDGEIQPSSDSSFKEFKAVEYGYRAVFKILYTYYNKYGLTTITSLINRWAPDYENDTSSYVKTVSSFSGISPTKELSFSKGEMTAIVAAMSHVENGVQADMDDVEKGWILFEESI